MYRKNKKKEKQKNIKCHHVNIAKNCKAIPVTGCGDP
jgi:hypothetical protein